MSIIIMLILLSILILVHEAGHFFAARFFKIKVEKFGFGLPIGPTLYETQCGDVKILIHAFLLGGYVAFPDDEKDCELDNESCDRFANKPVYQRAIVISAGVVANILCAFVLVFLTATLWGHMPAGQYNIYVKDIVAPKSESIWKSGIEKNDKIAYVNGEKINSTYSLLKFIQLSKSNDGKVSPSQAINTFIELKKLNPIFSKNEIIPNDVAIKLPAKQYEEPIQIDKKVLKGLKKYTDKQNNLTAGQKKLRDELKGKTIYVSNGKYSLNDVSYAMADSSHPISITVERKNKLIKLNTILVNKRGLIGAKLEAKEVLIPTTTTKSILVVGTKYLFDKTYMVIYSLYQLITGKVNLTDMAGIIAVTKIGGDIIANQGIFQGLLLTAIISINLAIINFLPIPALDGGYIMFMMLEKLRGKPVDEKIIEFIGNVCLWLLIALMIFTIFNDISGLITKRF